ncbi:type II toxin-antitoxin system RelE/ParE family toxin [Burkholderia anthina]|uniref:type II toxin-antitoxin system RelE/ParE family toxin n=1 Tax=Burkholderia anthina TaxID=179879 RepID=UPI00158D9921
MSRLIWTRAAQQAIVRLHRFLADQDPATVRHTIKAIRTGVNVLVQQPRLGRPVDEAGVAILAIRHRREAGY